MGLLAAGWERSGAARVGVGMGLLGAAFLVANVLGQFPGLEVLRDGGLATYGGLLLWGVGVAVLWKRPRPRPALVRAAAGPRTAAA
jgi:hypothetical protein